MPHTKAELEKEYAEVLDQVETLFRANRHLWEEIIRAAASAAVRPCHKWPPTPTSWSGWGSTRKASSSSFLELEKRA